MCRQMPCSWITYLLSLKDELHSIQAQAYLHWADKIKCTVEKKFSRRMSITGKSVATFTEAQTWAVWMPPLGPIPSTCPWFKIAKSWHYTIHYSIHSLNEVYEKYNSHLSQEMLSKDYRLVQNHILYCHWIRRNPYNRCNQDIYATWMLPLMLSNINLPLVSLVQPQPCYLNANWMVFSALWITLFQPTGATQIA
jgi:hypothetical protein